MWKGQIQKCYGSVRNANSYTSGRWLDEISTQLDNITNIWMPDILNTYGLDNYQNLNLQNNHTLSYDVRLMITNNTFYPKCYQVSKVEELHPAGVIKITLKQDDLNETRDNPDLGICDYYTEVGNIKKDIVEPDPPVGQSTIYWRKLGADGKLEPTRYTNIPNLERGKALYLEVEFSDTDVNPEWHITMMNSDDYTEDEISYYTGLISVTEFRDSIVSIKPAKAGSLSGKTFSLSVSDVNGNYYSSINLEVT